MSRRTTAIIIEAIPIVSLVICCVLMQLHIDSMSVRRIIAFTMLLALFGFAFFFPGRKLDREDRAVRILGILDWMTTIAVVIFYALVFIALGS